MNFLFALLMFFGYQAPASTTSASLLADPVTDTTTTDTGGDDIAGRRCLPCIKK